MFKNKLKNYFAFEIIKSFIFVLTSLSILIWIIQAAKFLNLITESGIPIMTYLMYIILQFPRSISQLIHFSFLIGIFLAIIKIQNNKELDIYWLSGFSKKEIINIIIKISLLLTIVSFFLFAYLAPLSNEKSRIILANSEFSLINSLVKENNFNSPIKEVTIFVHKNDRKGNLENIYIFENNKTIISKTGRILNIEDKKLLELSEGLIHEKNKNNDISTIKFIKTLYDFTKYQANFITTLKVQEKKIDLIIKEYKINKNLNFLYEIHKRIFKPLFIPVIALLCCFILFNNNEKIKSNNLKIVVFIAGTLLIIAMEILLNLSITNIYYKYFFYSFPFLSCYLINLILKKFLKYETKVY